METDLKINRRVYPREKYLRRIRPFYHSDIIKVITGIRRCGKFYLLRAIFRCYLLEQGVPEDHILSYELDLAKDIKYRNPLVLAKTVRDHVEGQADQYYLFVDAIQMSDKVANPYNPEGAKITFYAVEKKESKPCESSKTWSSAGSKPKS